MTLFLRDCFSAARHPAGIDKCPSAGAHGTGHAIHDVTASVLHKAGCTEPCSLTVSVISPKSARHRLFF